MSLTRVRFCEEADTRLRFLRARTQLSANLLCRAVERARAQLAALIGARPEEMIFTSGATEADNMALFGVAERYAERGDHIITCVTEHKAILDAAKRLEALGKRVTYLPVDQYGQIDLEELRAMRAAV